MLAFGKVILANWRLFGILAVVIILILIVSKVSEWKSEAERIPALVAYAEKLEKEAVQFQESLDRQRVEEQKRIDENKLVIAKQAKSIQQLKAENAKSPNIAIPTDKLLAIQAADKATN